MLYKMKENIITTYNKIEINKEITILTGNNGSGKSLIRKQLGHKLDKGLISLSTLDRMKPKEHLSALKNIMIDNEDDSTAASSYFILTKFFKEIEKNKKVKYAIIDEPEIGCSDETKLAFGIYLNKMMSKYNHVGYLVITHSSHIVRNINEHNFYNIDKNDLTKDEWLNRKIEPTNLEMLYDNNINLNAKLYKERKK